MKRESCYTDTARVRAKERKRAKVEAVRQMKEKRATTKEMWRNGVYSKTIQSLCSLYRCIYTYKKKEVTK